MLTASIFGIVPVARSRGPATDKGEAMRGLAELPWRPFAFGQARSVVWKAIGPNRLRGAFDDGRTQATVEFDIDDEGHVLAGEASDRPRVVGKSLLETAWRGTFGEYKMFGRVRVPIVAEVAWHVPEGWFTYWRGRVTEFRVDA